MSDQCRSTDECICGHPISEHSTEFDDALHWVPIASLARYICIGCELDNGVHEW